MAIFKKKQSSGPFLKKGEDIKQGDLVEIASEGRQEQGEYGTQNIFLIKTASKEGNMSLNQTTINALVDAYGEDSKAWIGKQAKVTAIKQMVAGKLMNVFYLSHPDAEMSDDGVFYIPNTQTSTKKSAIPDDEDRVNPEEIPF